MTERHPIDKALLGFEQQPSTFIPIILNIVSNESGLPVEIIKSKTRKREVVQARQIAMLLSSRIVKTSLANIGFEIGRKDHATVLHARKTILNITETDKPVLQLVLRCINILAMYMGSGLVCSICGGADVIRLAFINPNTDRFVRYKEKAEITDCICNTCHAYVPLVQQSKYRNKYEVNHFETVSNTV